MTRIDLIYFDGCPNVSQARHNLREAIATTGRSLTWSEWDLVSETTPAQLRRFASPTVLVDGQDVMGGDGEASAMACRADGVPSPDAIRVRLG